MRSPHCKKPHPRKKATSPTAKIAAQNLMLLKNPNKRKSFTKKTDSSRPRSPNGYFVLQKAAIMNSAASFDYKNKAGVTHRYVRDENNPAKYKNMGIVTGRPSSTSPRSPPDLISFASRTPKKTSTNTNLMSPLKSGSPSYFQPRQLVSNVEELSAR
jgi:hypothetical protein